MIKICTDSIHIATLQVALHSISVGVFDRQQRRGNQTFSGRPEWEPCLQLLLSCWSEPAWPPVPYSALLYFVPIVCVVPSCDPLFGLLFHYLSKLAALGVSSKEKQRREPSVRCYKLLARPAARPREPDLAAPRLRRVKRCTQRSSLHLYAPYIGRLLLQPTGTWLLAS